MTRMKHGCSGHLDSPTLRIFPVKVLRISGMATLFFCRPGPGPKPELEKPRRRGPRFSVIHGIFVKILVRCSHFLTTFTRNFGSQAIPSKFVLTCFDFNLVCFGAVCGRPSKSPNGRDFFDHRDRDLGHRAINTGTCPFSGVFLGYRNRSILK